MIELNPSSNLLEQDPYEYELQDVPQAQLFRDIYPYATNGCIEMSERLYARNHRHTE